MSSLARARDVLSRALLALAATAVLGAALVGRTAAQSPASTGADAAPDVTMLGPQVGQQVSGFSLPDQKGQVRSLTSLMGPKGLVLVFNRSADW